MAGFLVIVLVGFGIATLIRLSGRPKEEDVLERWSALLPGQAISGGEFLLQLEQEFANRNSDFKQSQMNFVGKLGATGTSAIKITHDMVHSCFVSYEVVGKDLHLNYALHQKKSVLYAVPFLGWILYHMLNVVYLHERNKLIAFSAVTLDCVRKVTDNLSDELGLSRDDVKIKAASGVLGPL